VPRCRLFGIILLLCVYYIKSTLKDSQCMDRKSSGSPIMLRGTKIIMLYTKILFLFCILWFLIRGAQIRIHRQQTTVRNSVVINTKKGTRPGEPRKCVYSVMLYYYHFLWKSAFSSTRKISQDEREGESIITYTQRLLVYSLDKTFYPSQERHISLNAFDILLVL